MAKTNSEYVINFTKKRRHNLITLFDSKCCICGFDKYEEALDFHHINPEEKLFGLSSNVMKSLDKQILEAKKCILVCANCHRGIHAGYIQTPANYQDFFNEDKAKELLELNDKIRHGELHYCIDCGVIISKDATRCDKCSRIAQRVTERPSREELKNLIRNYPFTTIAIKYGVSDNAIRKWCKTENLPTKKLDIKSYTDQEWEKI